MHWPAVRSEGLDPALQGWRWGNAVNCDRLFPILEVGDTIPITVFLQAYQPLGSVTEDVPYLD